ncbi:hypothetical protein M758_12G136900 [Ceratodon purpureus]|uniref:Uncharacterized protein n=1 Tax=Ceratodon purpureus TaxID=3225 RepID=A0A8T0G9D2_CERPU|nr:hypothetical protein KC19_12G133800 [Ceratodon purpureus]KAG0599222.1 hypothetical protein M758_12G136900 [Ceratodon purpureus]
MATVLIATPFVRSQALRNQASVSDVGGVHAPKRLRVSCRQASVGGSGEGRRLSVLSDIATSQDEISIFQASSTHSTLSDWIVSFLLKEDHVQEQEPEPAVAAPIVQMLEPVAEIEATKLHQVERRRPKRTVVFTEEKARRLRQENRATQTFHDKWYHSAIASRLATPE